MTRSGRFLTLFLFPMIVIPTLLVLRLARGDSGAILWPKDIWFWTHVTLLVIALIGLLTSVLSAVLYLWQSSQLKSKKLGSAFFRLPGLHALDNLHFRALAAGVIFFSLGILSGFFWATDLKELGSVWSDPKVTLSFVTCLFYWGVVSLRLSPLGRGQKIAAGTLVAFTLLFLTFISSCVSPSSFHRGF